MERTIYSKYSNERAGQFRIRTDIVTDASGRKKVYKCALEPEGEAHIGHIHKAYGRLTEVYRNTAVAFCACEVSGNCVSFPFVEGKTLQEILEDAVEKKDGQAVGLILQEYIRRIGQGGGSIPFQATEEFCRVFGEQIPEGKPECALASDIDMIFSNILVREEAPWKEDAGWQVIDYEWTFDFPIPKAFILYRALYFAYYQIFSGTEWSLPRLYEMAQITEAQAVTFARMEEHFQNYLRTGSLPVRNMQRKLGTRIISLEQLLAGQSGSGQGTVETVSESEWLKVRKIQYHIDRTECQDGSIICSGWAFARVKDGRSLPVNIRVTDDAGQPVPAEVIRTERRDVAKALKIRNVTAPVWGFDCVWMAPMKGGWHIHFSLGKLEKSCEAVI